MSSCITCTRDGFITAFVECRCGGGRRIRRFSRSAGMPLRRIVSCGYSPKGRAREIAQFTRQPVEPVSICINSPEVYLMLGRFCGRTRNARRASRRIVVPAEDLVCGAPLQANPRVRPQPDPRYTLHTVSNRDGGTVSRYGDLSGLCGPVDSLPWQRLGDYDSGGARWFSSHF